MKPFVGKRVEPRSFAGRGIQSFQREQCWSPYAALDGGQVAGALFALGGAFLHLSCKCHDHLEGWCGRMREATEGSRGWLAARRCYSGSSRRQLQCTEWLKFLAQRGMRERRRRSSGAEVSVCGGVQFCALRRKSLPCIRLCWCSLCVVVRNRWQVGRSSTRPVLKHGPRSLTCARVVGQVRNPEAQ